MKKERELQAMSKKVEITEALSANGTDPFAAFWSFVEYVEEMAQLTALTTVAYTNMTGLGRLAAALRKSDEEIARKEELERLALDEVARGFPLLMAHTAVGLWSALEAAVTAFTVDWLCYKPSLLQSEALSKTKVPAVLLSTKDFREAAAFVIDEFNRGAGGQRKEGVGRFTTVLDALGINVAVEDDERKTLFELSKVRNIYAHRFGIVDAQFKSACPWVEVDLGKRLQTTSSDIMRYMKAAREFAASVCDAAQGTMTETEREKVAAIQEARTG